MSKPSESAVRWGEIVRGQGASGLSVAAYCRRARVPASSFYYWRRKLRDAGFDGANAARFAEVRVTSESAPERVNAPVAGAGALEVRLPGGCRIVVHPGFDRRTFLELVAALQRGITGAGNGLVDDDDVADRETGV